MLYTPHRMKLTRQFSFSSGISLLWLDFRLSLAVLRAGAFLAFVFEIDLLALLTKLSSSDEPSLFSVCSLTMESFLVWPEIDD